VYASRHTLSDDVGTDVARKDGNSVGAVYRGGSAQCQPGWGWTAFCGPSRFGVVEADIPAPGGSTHE